MQIYHNHCPIIKTDACKNIIKHLPDWFGIEESNQQYIQDAKKLPAIVAEDDANIIGLLLYKELFDETLSAQTINVHWLGILPEYHHKGIGLKLMQEVEQIASEKNINILSVETLSPIAEDKHYLQTYNFYCKYGFKTFKEFKYNKQNPMVMMSKKIIII